MTRRLLTHTPRHRLRSPDGLRRCHPPCLLTAAPRPPTTPALLRRFRSSGAPTRFAAMEASNVIGCAVDAAPSRAGPRLNSSATTRRPAGQRRITARVMRSFTPRGRGVHTLPFQAHPRVASRPKSPAPAVATLFGLPATLRVGTESVLFPGVWLLTRYVC